MTRFIPWRIEIRNMDVVSLTKLHKALLSLWEGDYSVFFRIVLECIARPFKSARSRIINLYLILSKCKR